MALSLLFALIRISDMYYSIRALCSSHPITLNIDLHSQENTRNLFTPLI